MTSDIVEGQGFVDFLSHTLNTGFIPGYQVFPGSVEDEVKWDVGDVNKDMLGPFQ
jgi:hypothetical protein